MSRDGLMLYFRDYDGGDGTPLVCLSGLTRNSRDFHPLASALQHERRIIAGDLRGRGQSDYDPESENYRLPTYVTDTWDLLRHAGIDRAVVIGSSLGGLMAMMMAAQQPAKLAGVILNDMGPEIAREGLERIRTQAGQLGPVRNWEQARDQTREIYGRALPGLDDEQWMQYARCAYRAGPDGVPRLDVDPRVGEATPRHGDLPDPWALFEALTMPALVLRGELSDILAPQTLERMRARKPALRTAMIANRGHAPLLDEPDSVEAIRAFLRHVDAL